MNYFLLILLSFFSITTSLASDSLKIKQVYYFEDSLLVRTESFNSKGLVISVLNNGYREFDENAEPTTNYIFREFFENSNIVKAYWTFNLKSENRKLYFQDENCGVVFQRQFNSKKKIYIDKLKWISVNDFQKPINIDSLRLYTYIFSRDNNRQKRILKYDKKENLIYEKRIEAEQMQFECKTEYDSLSREIKKSIKNRVEFPVIEDSTDRFFPLEETIETQTITHFYDDINHIQTSYLEIFRKNKLHQKRQLKNFYDSKNNLLKQEEYTYDVLNFRASEHPKLISIIENFYENDIRTKKVYHFIPTNLIRTQYLHYEFW